MYIRYYSLSEHSNCDLDVAVFAVIRLPIPSCGIKWYL